MWGFHIGCGFSTYIRHGGLWAVAAMVLVIGDLRLGACVMMTYWLGRVLSVWLSPIVFAHDSDYFGFLDDISTLEPQFRRASVLGLGWMFMLALLMLPFDASNRIGVVTTAISHIDWLYVSFCLLWFLTLVPALLLKTVLSKTLVLAKERDELIKQRAKATASVVPSFSSPLLGSDTTVTSADLVGQETILLFIRPEDGSQEADVRIHQSAHILYHKAKLYIICRGSQEKCQEAAREAQFSDVVSVPVLLDRDGAISQQFQVSRTPIAFKVNEKGQITSVGHLESIGL